MKYFLGIVVLSSLLMAAQFGPRLANSGKTMYRYSITLNVANPMQSGPMLRWLRDHDFDIAGVNWKMKQVEVITTDAGIALLKQNHFQGRVLAVKTPGGADKLEFDERYYNPAKVEQRLKDLHAKYPTLTSLEQIGTSAQGRAIWALLISTTPQSKNPDYYMKPSILMDGLHHAREIMTPEVVMDVAETFLQNPTPEYQNLLSHWNVWLVPLLNVDGSNVVWTENSWWRKNVRMVRNSLEGVDVNRNYAYRWGACDGSSGDQSSETYRGPSANSEAETQALEKLAEVIRPTAYLSYHSYSEFVLYPYGCQNDVTGEAQLHDKIGHELANLLPSDSNDKSFYTPGTPWQILYGVDGDSMSYMYSEYGATSFTFEINKEFQPDYSLRQPTVEKHRKAWTYFMNRLGQNMLTLKVVDSKTNTPVPAVITISTIAQVKGEKPFRTNKAGVFFKALDPGAYTLQVRLEDGRQKEVKVNMNGQPQVGTVAL